MEPKRFVWAASRNQSATRLMGKTCRRSARWLALAAMPMAVGLASKADAISLTWDSGGTHPLAPVDGSGNWDTTTSALWSNGLTDSVWINGDAAIFGSNNGVAGTVTIDDPSGVIASGLTFNAASSGNYTIAASGGDILTLTGTTPTITVATGLTPTISAAIAGTNGLSFTGAGSGVLILSGSSNYSGNTTINSGQLQITNATGFGSSTVPSASSAADRPMRTTTARSLTVLTSPATAPARRNSERLVNQNHSETYGGTITLAGNARIGNGGFTSTFSNPIAGGTSNIEFFSSASGTSTFKPASTASIWAAATVTAAGSGNSILFMTYEHHSSHGCAP